jgi:xanthine dehydrogenase accessory factor
MRNIYIQFLDLLSDHPDMVLSTVTRSIGSTPQKPGSSAIFGKSGLLSGTVGGGVLEGKVQELSQIAIGSKDSSHPTFLLNKDISNGEDAICGGQVSILIDSEPVNSLSVFNELKRSMAERIPGVLITVATPSEGEKVVVKRIWMTQKSLPALLADQNEMIVQEVNSILAKGDRFDFREVEHTHTENKTPSVILFEPVFPPPSLVIIGAGHIGKALAHLGSLLNFEVTVIDDRPDYASMENFPDADHIVVEDIGSAMKNLIKKTDTYIVIVTRGHKDDAEALKQCINSEAAYVGMIGSKTKIAAMKRNFIENGWSTEKRWNFIHAPVGLEISSKTVEEIAVSIAGQLVLVKNRRK